MKSILLKSKSLFACGLLVMGLTSVGTAYAIDYEKSGKTTCYTFKNDKMIKKASCTYKETGGYTGSAGNIEVIFKMQGVQKSTKVGISWYLSDSGYELNDKEAISFYRFKSNLKKATDAQADKAFEKEDNGYKQLIKCMKGKNGDEFCYADVDGRIGTVS